MVVSAGRGRDRVDGRSSPGKDVNKTFNVYGEAMVRVFFLVREMMNYLVLSRHPWALEDGGF